MAGLQPLRINARELLREPGLPKQIDLTLPAAELGVDDPLRVTLAASQMVGVAMLRYVVGLEPLASADVTTILDHVAPTLHHHLFG